ncbi:MAG: DUF502 domain-containing protein [Deltaproteobacteria bacterium]|nr:DUF502 domain-containing protein [Deltaproteobacteria bacterium]MBW2382860.1 DUF502 domain-containing protein [Deltaproteobacteria bacterium]
MWSRVWQVTRDAVRRYFVAGLLAFAPIAITVWAIGWIIGRLDNLLLPRVIEWLFPALEEPPSLPPLVGALFTFVVILLAGVVVRHLFGHELVRVGERLLSRVPVASSIYYAVKQLFEAIVSSSDKKASFSRVVLVEYPRKGLWGIAFVTGYARGPLVAAIGDGPMLNCFIPTTPNPTSGFYLLVPETDIVEVDLSVEDAFKVIMSAGLVTPTATTVQPELPGLES